MSRNYSREEGTPFARIFGAVLLALIVYGLLQAAVTALLARAAIQEVSRQLDAAATQPMPAIRDVPQRSPGVQLPSLPGPVQALRDRKSQACINGFISSRLESGWDQGNERCVAWSD